MTLQEKTAWVVFVVCLSLFIVLFGFMIWVQPIILVGLAVFFAFIWAASIIEKKP